MTRPARNFIAASVALALIATFSGSCWLHAHDGHAKRRPWPKATPPPPPSPIYHQSPESAPTEAQIAAEAATHNLRIASAVERALLSYDARAREAAFTFLLPELVQLEPRLVVEMIEAQTPGEARDTLRTELARQWVERDPEAAVGWMKSLDGVERRASAEVAVREIGPADPVRALAIAGEFGVSLEPGLERAMRERARARLGRS